MPRFHSHSISRRLTTMNLLVSGTALLIASIAFFLYDQSSVRNMLVRNLSAQAQIVGSNSVSALIFNDPQTATKTLSALGESPSVLSAGLLTPEGKLFAEYSREKTANVVKVPTLAPGETESFVYSADELMLVRSILFEGKLTGYVYIRSDLATVSERRIRHATITTAVLLLSLLAVLAVSGIFRRTLARPIASLAETARVISRERDYGVRVPPVEEPRELATLVEAFNEMLTQIEKRDEALRGARDDLEQRVQDRTRELLAANRELEAFSYSVSHDLRGPLDTIAGFVHILQTDYGDKLGRDGREYLRHVSTSTQRMADLIDDLLNLSRVTTTAMRRENVDLSALARSVSTELRRREPDRKVDFVIANGIFAQGDARLLRIVLENLFSNAWKYTSSHPQARIEFGSKQDDSGRVFFVRDDGAGFDLRYSDRLFKPFQRLHATSDFPGTGIGLATVQRIVHRHGGEIWAEGAVERGATFYFTVQNNDAAIAHRQHTA